MIIEGVQLLEEGCEGLERVNQVEQRQKSKYGGRIHRSPLPRMNALVRAQARGEVEACLEKQFGI